MLQASVVEVLVEHLLAGSQTLTEQDRIDLFGRHAHSRHLPHGHLPDQIEELPRAIAVARESFLDRVDGPLQIGGKREIHDAGHDGAVQIVLLDELDPV